MSIVVGTSIAPKGIDNQQLAVASWLRLGFSVISVNIPEEIKFLQDKFPEVKFIPAARSAQSIIGRPFVYFDDILAVLKNEGATVCGIVNSDIHMQAPPGLTDFLAMQTQGAMVFASRTEVSASHVRVGKPYLWGFDAFFFPSDMISLYPASAFCLGAPWWDYWAPLVPLLRGIPTRYLISPVAFHVSHSNNWPMKLHDHYGDELFKQLDSNWTTLSSSEGKLIPHAVLVATYILAKATKIELEDSPEPTRSSVSLLAGLEATKELNSLVEKAKEIQAQIDGLRYELLGIKQSLSWRVTAPLRRLKALLSKPSGVWQYCL